MKKIIVISALCAVFSLACVMKTAPRSVVDSTQLIVEQVKPLVVSHQASNLNLAFHQDPALEHAFNAYLKKGIAPHIVQDGYANFAYQVGVQPIITTSPFQETVISLEPGERFTNISSGDPSQWSYVVVNSGENIVQQHVLVKPALAHLSTNMVIATNRRLYNLRLISVQSGQITRQVRFWYPDYLVNQLNQHILEQRDLKNNTHAIAVSLDRLNFNYRIRCVGLFRACPLWTPIRAFDDGVKTYVQFNQSVSNEDMPALFIINAHEQELVNYRFHAPYFVIDKIFKEAVLITGVGQHQQKVRLFNEAIR